MRNMIQLFGGVAAAGLVAAGATAFTGSGLASTVTAPNSFIGGSTTVSVAGATIDTVTYGYSDGSVKQQLSTIALHLTDVNSAGAAVTLATTVTGGSNPTWTCTAVSAQASTCTAGVPYDLTTGSITNYTVKVV